MSLFRRLPTRRLIAVIAGTVAAAGAITAIAVAATSGGSAPATKPLPAALRDALTAPAVPGVTARVTFTNSMLGASGVQGSDPMLTGASGRLWARADGHLRLELQSDAGDAQILSDGKTLSLYSASANTLYKVALPAERAGAKRHRGKAHGVPTIGAIDRALRPLMGQADLSGATGTTVAGRPAYTVRIAPKKNGGLVGAAELAWDAATGTPLRVAVYAKGAADPVLELKVTDIAFGPVADDAFITPAPQGAKVIDLTPQLAAAAARGAKHGKGTHKARKPVSGARAVQAALPFTLAAPDTLAGLPRTSVRLIGANGKQGALVTYGQGLGTIAVLQMAVTPKDAGAPIPGGGGGRDGGGLPSVSINGAPAQELPTPLGTILTFTRDGVRYVVAGSVTRETAEAAARGL